MIKHFILLLLVCLQFSLCYGEYDFLPDPIDVVIPCCQKDKETLDLCIENIKKYCRDVRRIIIVSEKPLTDKAEWFPEYNYPFSKNDISFYLLRNNPSKAEKFLLMPNSRLGWYYQQLLKLYTPVVIPHISSNVLIVDADTIFLQPLAFLNDRHGGLYSTENCGHPPYFVHAKQLIPHFKRVFPELSGICNHMLFQRPVIEDLFHTVEQYHHQEFWKMFCTCVSLEHLNYSGASEYEIYFNFVFTRSKKVELRPLKGKSSDSLDKLSDYEKEGYHYITFHDWMRKKQ